ncbi:hypothetical protein B0H14DRAFT_2686964 [Mycena olivaceomarginata]|nr:hypothetical protein B0H14DRAFT_2686964 [Mycena olivaceomarginata]
MLFANETRSTDEPARRHSPAIPTSVLEFQRGLHSATATAAASDTEDMVQLRQNLAYAQAEKGRLVCELESERKQSQRLSVELAETIANQRLLQHAHAAYTRAASQVKAVQNENTRLQLELQVTRRALEMEKSRAAMKAALARTSWPTSSESSSALDQTDARAEERAVETEARLVQASPSSPSESLVPTPTLVFPRWPFPAIGSSPFPCPYPALLTSTSPASPVLSAPCAHAEPSVHPPRRSPAFRPDCHKRGPQIQLVPPTSPTKASGSAPLAGSPSPGKFALLAPTLKRKRSDLVTHSPGPDGDDKRSELKISHIPLLYETQGNVMYCRSCRRGFPATAGWAELVEHSTTEHPEACVELRALHPAQEVEQWRRLHDLGKIYAGST